MTEKTKEVQEGTGREELPAGPASKGSSAPPGDEPKARIDVSFIEEDGYPNTRLIVVIAAPIGGVVLLVFLIILFNLIFRGGRRSRGLA